MFPERVDFTAPKTLATIALVVLVALVPLISHALAQPYYVTLASRIIIYALAASSLNLILGYGGMVSFGHALYFGLGAYAVGILSFHGIFNGWVHLLATLCAAGLVALITGIICLRTRGMLVSYGQSSGAVAPFDPLRLGKKGAYITRPSLAHYIATRAELEWRSRELLDSIRAGALRIRIDREIPLRDAGEAHRLLESRKTMGKLLLIP